jgi:hypothetical protein
MAEIRSIPPVTATARTVHRCDFCCDQIAVGERYVTDRGFDRDRRNADGSGKGAWVSDRRHLRCTPEAIRNPTAA